MKSIQMLSVMAATIVVANISPVADAAPLRDIPAQWTQPDGTVVNLMVSGDERHRTVTDADGFTVLRNFDTGWLMYADIVDGKLAPTLLAAGLDDPLAAGLLPGLHMPFEQAEGFISRKPVPRASGDPAPTTGTVNNLFVFIRFSDDDILLEETAGYETQFNGVAQGEPSLRAYFREISQGAVDVVTTFTPAPDGKWMTAYTAPQLRRHYQPYDAVHNPGGYTNDSELEQREHALLKDALAYVEAVIPDGVDFDANDDGYFDNVIFMVQGWPDTWSDLLWPHMWEFYDEVTCKGLHVGTYNLQLSVLMLISPGTFVHEMYHSFGAPDLYHYSQDNIQPVGPWDVMENTGLYAAQHPLAYMKWKYGNWVADIPVVSENSEVTLTQDWTDGAQAVRIAVPESQSEYFVLEYRRRQGMFETSLPGSGLLVYRIDPDQEDVGNRNGPPDEVWIFRQGGVPYATGEIGDAAMRPGRRTVMNEFTDPAPALGDGTPVTLRVYDVGDVGDSISFKVCLNPPGCGAKICGDDGCGGWCGDCPDGNRCDDGACVPCSCVDRACGDNGCGVSCGECDDENPCTTDSCVEFGCVYSVNGGSPCDDGDTGTENDVCDVDAVCAGTPIPAEDTGTGDQSPADVPLPDDDAMVADNIPPDAAANTDLTIPADSTIDAATAEVTGNDDDSCGCSQGPRGAPLPAVVMISSVLSALAIIRRRHAPAARQSGCKSGKDA